MGHKAACPVCVRRCGTRVCRGQGRSVEQEGPRWWTACPKGWEAQNWPQARACQVEHFEHCNSFPLRCLCCNHWSWLCCSSTSCRSDCSKGTQAGNISQALQHTSTCNKWATTRMSKRSRCAPRNILSACDAAGQPMTARMTSCLCRMHSALGSVSLYNKRQTHNGSEQTQQQQQPGV